MWKNILGHKKEIALLQKAIQENKLAHAYLFSGIEGIGKYTVALGLAKALECKSDLQILEPQGTTIKIEAIRELKETAYLHPLEGKAKMILIDQADTLTDAAANALLKILEEPPSQTYFILITPKPLKLLPTIRSRCQNLEFSPLPTDLIIQKLLQEGMAPEEAKQRALLGEGSLKQAIELDIALAEQIEKELQQLGNKPPPSEIFKTAQNWIDDEEKIPQLLGILNHLWHQKIVAQNNETGREITIQQWNAIQNAGRGLESYANKQLLMENLLFTLTA